MSKDKNGEKKQYTEFTDWGEIRESWITDLTLIRGLMNQKK